MKKQLLGIGIALLLFGGVVNSNASLIIYDDDVVYDNIANQYWFRDLSIFVSQDYQAQLDRIADSTFVVDVSYWGNWEMADLTDINNLFSHTKEDIVAAFSPARWTGDGGSGDYEWYYGRVDNQTVPLTHDVFGIQKYSNGGMDFITLAPISDTEASAVTGAWVVANATHEVIIQPVWGVDPAPAPAPEPATMLLFATGLAGLVGIGIKRKRR